MYPECIEEFKQRGHVFGFTFWNYCYFVWRRIAGGQLETVAVGGKWRLGPKVVRVEINKAN